MLFSAVLFSVTFSAFSVFSAQPAAKITAVPQKNLMKNE
jgi:hypothetical protein